MRVRAGQGEEADCMIAGIEATNNLDHEIFISVPLYINQRIAETKSLFFRGHEKRYIEFHYKFQQGGEYQVSIADQLPKEVSIEGGIRIIRASSISRDTAIRQLRARLTESPRS